jgi:hypothetical protein
MLSDGSLEICGRCDSMVKIRGYSIETQVCLFNDDMLGAEAVGRVPWTVGMTVCSVSCVVQPNYAYLYFCHRLCALVVRVPGYRSGGPGFDSWALQEKKK